MKSGAIATGQKVKEHAYGKGRVIWGKTTEEVLGGVNHCSFSYTDPHGGPTLLYAHHALGNVDFYFVANKQKQAVAGTARFRVDGRQPEFWWPETGKIEPVAVYSQENGVTSIPMQLDASESCIFVVFRNAAAMVRRRVRWLWMAGRFCQARTSGPPLRLRKRLMGSQGMPNMPWNVTTQLQTLVDKNGTFRVADIAGLAGDPAPGMVKTLAFNYTVNGKPHEGGGTDQEVITLAGDDQAAERIVRVETDADGKLRLEAWKSGNYQVKPASGRGRQVSVGSLPPPIEISGPWQATFPFQKTDVSFDKLASWSESPQPEVKYFSGTATYHKSFQIPGGIIGAGHRLYLDLGDVE